MDVLLIRDGVVENCICADSVERAQQFYPQHLCIERTEALREWGPGDLHDGMNFSKAPRVVVVTPITRLEFLRRFTPEQRINIRSSSDPVIRDGMGMLDLAQEVRTDDANTVFFVGYLVQQNFITQADADRILGVTP